ncbi:hypothetical protein PENTCL1PPCAC_22694, partial [Pristionchus entomophagus]
LSTNISVFFDYQECGFMKKNGHWELQVIFSFPSSEDACIVHCESQSIKNDKRSMPRRFEESLEEFQLIPIKIEQKAPLPTVFWSLTEDNLTELFLGYGRIY